MQVCAFTFANAVRTIWVSHKLKLLIVFNQFVDQHLGIIIMHVVIASAVDIQQISL